MRNMKQYWESISRDYLKTDKHGYGAVCYTGMPLWFNRFFDYWQKKCFFSLIKTLDLRDADILDIGCGVGRWSRLLSLISRNVIGIDIDRARLEKAREVVGSEVTFIETSAESVPLEDNRFDFVNSVTVLQHIPPTQRDRVMGEIGRLTRKGGHVLIIELIDLFDDAPHVFPLSREEWIESFRALGFEVIKETGFEYIPLLRTLRRLQHILKGSKTIRREGGAVRLSRWESLVLRITILFSYPAEYVCMKLLKARKARHIGLLFRKT